MVHYSFPFVSIRLQSVLTHGVKANGKERAQTAEKHKEWKRTEPNLHIANISEQYRRYNIHTYIHMLGPVHRRIRHSRCPEYVFHISRKVKSWDFYYIHNSNSFSNWSKYIYIYIWNNFSESQSRETLGLAFTIEFKEDAGSSKVRPIFDVTQSFWIRLW